MSEYIQLLCHLIGDYLFQNDWMALNKKEKTWKGWLAVVIHGLFYTVPFWIAYQLGFAPLMWLWPTLGLIFVSHIIIDRWNFPTWWTRVKNWRYTKEKGYYGDYYWEARPDWEDVTTLASITEDKEDTMGMPKYIWTPIKDNMANSKFLGRPGFIGVWLLIITDNIIHLVLNFAIIRGMWMLYEIFSRSLELGM